MLVTMSSAGRSRRAVLAPADAPSPGTRLATRARPVLLWTGVALVALAADAAAKAWALSALRGGHQITVTGGLIRLRLIANHGAAFGFGAGYEPLVVLAWVLLFSAPLVAGALAGKRCHVPDDPAQASAARAWQGVAAGLVSNGVGALTVTALGTGTTALMLKSAWVRDWLYHGQHLTASAV